MEENGLETDDDEENDEEYDLPDLDEELSCNVL